MAEGIEEHEAWSVVSFGILLCHVGVFADDGGVVSCFESIVCHAIDGVFYLSAIASLELKVGVSNESRMFVVGEGLDEFLSVCLSVVSMSYA